MVTAEEILREAEEALEKEKKPSPTLNSAEQILAEAEDVLERERMALPPVVAEKRTVAIPLTEAAKGVTPPPLPNIDKAAKPMAQLGGVTGAYVPPKSYAPAPKPEPQKPEEAANQDAAYMEYAGMAPQKPKVTADEMFKGAEFRAPDQGVMAWLLGEEKAPLKSPKIIGEAPKEEPAPSEKLPTKQPDIFLYLVREKQGFDLSPQEQEMLNSLNPEELSQVKNQREDIIFSEDLDRKVFEYRRPTKATVPRDEASWLNIFPAAAGLAGTAASSVADFGLSAATGGVEATVGYMNAFASGTDQGLANQLIFQLPEDRKKVVQEKIRAAELDPTYSEQKLLEIVLQEYSPEQREEILKKKENIVQTAKAILPAYVSSAVDQPYQVAAVGQKVNAGGIEAFDLLNEAMPWGSREKSFQNFRARSLFNGARLFYENKNPTPYARYLDALTPVIESLAQYDIPSVEQYMEDYGYSKEEATNVRNRDIESRKEGARELIDEQKQELWELNPNIVAAGDLTLPQSMAMGPFGYGSALVSAGAQLTPKVIRAMRTAGLTEKQLAVLQRAERMAQSKKARAALEAKQKVSRTEKVATYVDETLKQAEAAYKESKFIKALQGVAPYAAGAGVGYMASSENQGLTGIVLGALGGRAVKSAPGSLRAYLEAGRASAGGRVGRFETMSKMAREASAAKAGAAGEATAAANIAKGSVAERILQFGGRKADNIINNTGELIKAGVEPTLVGLATGIIDSQDGEQMAQVIGEGLLWTAFGLGQNRVKNKILGTSDPVLESRRRREQDVDILKFRQTLPAEDRATLDGKLTSWETAIAAQRQSAEAAKRRYAEKKAELEALDKEPAETTPAAKAEFKVQEFVGPDGKKYLRRDFGPETKAQKRTRLKEEMKDASLAAQANEVAANRMRRAGVQTQNEYGRQFMSTVARFNELANGGASKGQNNVNLRILTSQQIRNHLLKKYPNAMTDPSVMAAIDMAASQTGFYDAPTTTEYRPGMTPTDRQNVGVRMDDLKPSIVINADEVVKRANSLGRTPIEEFAHEAGHLLGDIPEFRDLTEPARRKLFRQDFKDAQGNVIASTDGVYSDADLTEMFVTKYLEGASPDFVASMMTRFAAEQPGINKYGLDEARVAKYMQDEIMSDLAGGSISRLFGNSKGDIRRQVIQNALTFFKMGEFRNMVRTLRSGLAGYGIGSRLTFSPELQAMADKALRELEDLQGQISSPIQGEAAPKITKLELSKTKNRGILERFGWMQPVVKREVVAVVQGPDGKVIGEPQIINDLMVYEGEWGVSDAGVASIGQTYGPIASEVNTAGLPVGSKITIRGRVATNPDGSPKWTGPLEARKLAKLRKRYINEALDTPDYGAPNRFDPTKAGGETYRGTLSDMQIEAIKNLPESIIPKRLKEYFLQMNDVIRRGKGERVLIDYAPMMNDKGEYVAFSPKIYDLVPIGLMMSKAGNLLVVTVSAGRLFGKLDAWAERMPLRLQLWQGSKQAFYTQFAQSFLDNLSKGLRGSGYDESGNISVKKDADGNIIAQAKPLDADPKVAEKKRDIFNDFLNLFDKETEGANPDRTQTPRRKGDPKGLDFDRTIMSVRIDHIAELAESGFEPLPISYGLVKKNFLPRREIDAGRQNVFDQEAPEKLYTAGQQQYLPSRYSGDPVSMVEFDGTYKGIEGKFLAKIRVVAGLDGKGAFVPDLYFDGGSAKDSQLLTKPASKTFEQAHADLDKMFRDNNLPIDEFEAIEAPVVGTDRKGYEAGAWENILKANGFERLIPSLEDQLDEQEARENAKTPSFRDMESSKNLLDDALNTRWIINFANGEKAIEYGYNKEAIVNLMKSRYGEQQWIEWVDSIDRLTDANNPQSEQGFLPSRRFERPEDLPEDDVLRRKDRFEEGALDLVNMRIGGNPIINMSGFDRSFHLTTIARRILDDFEPDVYMRLYRRFIEKLENGQVEGMAPEQAAERAASLQKNIELNKTAMSYMMDLFSDLAASLPDISAKDKRTGDNVDPFMVLKGNFDGGMKRPIDEVLLDMSNVMAAVHPPAGTFPDGYNPGYSPNNDILNAAQVMSDFVDISPETMDTLYMRTMGKTERQAERDEAKAMSQLLNPEFNDVTDMGGGIKLVKPIEPPKDEEGGVEQKFLPKRIKLAAKETTGEDAKKSWEDLVSKEGWFYFGNGFMARTYPEGNVTLEFRPSSDNTWRLSFITTPEAERGKGLASRVLKEITDEADAKGIKMTLDVDPQDEGGLSTDQLFDWYARNGFERVPYTMQDSSREVQLSDSMERIPKSTKEDEKPLRIVSAAIRNEKTGKIYTGIAHPLIYEQLPASAFKGVPKGSEPDYFSGEGWNSPEGMTDGFVDEAGKFYDREDALIQAQKAKQYTPTDRYDDRLEASALEAQEKKRLDSSDPNARFLPQRITPELDAEYLNLSKEPEKNRTKLQQLVDDAARAAGYTVMDWWHGTKKAFNEFKATRYADGLIFFSKSRDFSENWAKNRKPSDEVLQRIEAVKKESNKLVNQLFEQDERFGPNVRKWGENTPEMDAAAQEYLEAGRQFERDNLDGMTWLEAEREMGTRLVRAYLKTDKIFNPAEDYRDVLPALLKRLGVDSESEITKDTMDLVKKGGYLIWEDKPLADAVFKKYDAMMIQEDSTGPMDTISVRDPSLIKLADPITRDDQGNVIPLSQRFNQNTTDIRYLPAKKLDANYADLEAKYKKGDESAKEEAQKLIDEKAKTSGWGSDDTLYHGTTHNFTVFDTVNSNVENDLGKGFYFTSNLNDAEKNYAGEGPDLTSRIERKAEEIFDNRLVQSKTIEEVQNFAEENGIDFRSLKVEPYGSLPVDSLTSIKHSLAKAVAQKQLSGGGQQTLRTYVRLENPAILGGENESRLEYNYDEQTDTESGSAIKMIEAIRNVVPQFTFGDSSEKVVRSLLEDGDLDGMPLSKAVELLKNSEALQDAVDENGDSAVGEVVRQILQEVGYDGIIDNTVDTKFGSQRKLGRQMEGMTPDTYHVIAFEPNQIKSAEPFTYDNEGKLIPLSQRFNRENPDVRFLPERNLPVEGSPKSRDPRISDVAAEAISKNLRFGVDQVPFDVKMPEGWTLEGDIYVPPQTATPDARFLPKRITPKQDANYLKLAEDPEANQDKLQKIVDKAAKDAGYNIKGFHGTYKNNQFRVFDDLNASPEIREWLSTHPQAGYVMTPPGQGWNPEGIHIGTEQQAKTVLELRGVEEDNGVIIPLYAKANYIKRVKDGGSWRPIIAKAIKEGYDGLVYKNDFEGKGDSYILFNDYQVKRADPVTYDVDGSVIPISQRFDVQNPDMNFLPKRKNPPVADFTIAKTGVVKLPKKVPARGFFYAGLIDDTGTEILVKVDPTRVVNPVVKDLSDISGKRVGMVQADRHHTLGKDMGGPMHEFLKSNQETVMGPDGILYKPVWGNLGLGPVNGMRNRLPNVDDGYHIVQIMADDAHRSNIAFGTDYIKEVDAFDKAGKLEPWVKDLAHVLLEVGNLRAQKIKAATRRGAKNRIRAEKGEDPIPAPVNTPEEDAIIAFNRALTPIKNRVSKNDPQLLATAKKEALRVYNEHKNKPWFKRLLKLGSNKNFLQEFLGYSFTARGEATKSVSGIPDLPNVVNALQDSEDMINATTGQAVAIIQLSANPQAFALYFGKNPKQEAAMTPAEKKMRDKLLKNPKFKIHPSYPWVMLGPANGNNFLIKTPTHLRKLFPNYEKQHKKLAANAKKGKPVTDNDVVGSMLKTPLPEIKIP